jgi:hypothetical protein
MVGGDVSDCLQPAKALPMDDRQLSPLARRRRWKGNSFVKFRSLILTALVLGTAACGGKRVEDGGVYITRSVCPQVGVPAATGDITLFDPAGRTDAAAIDVVATITNLRATCDDAASQVLSNATFDIVARRRDAGPARTVTLQYFDVAMQGGTQVVAKRLGTVTLNFAAGSLRAATRAQAAIRVNRSAVTLPADVRAKLTRPRKAGDVDAAIDPMSDPATRAAVARATFEHLIGFQLTQAQLQYNATR